MILNDTKKSEQPFFLLVRTIKNYMKIGCIKLKINKIPSPHDAVVVIVILVNSTCNEQRCANCLLGVRGH